MGTAQTINSEIGVVQKRISSVMDQQESTSYNLNQEGQASDPRARTMQSSVMDGMEELGERINEIRDSDMISSIPPSVIQSLSDTIMDGALKSADGYVLNELSLQISGLISPNCRRGLTPLFCFREPLLSNPLVSPQSITYMKKGVTNLGRL